MLETWKEKYIFEINFETWFFFPVPWQGGVKHKSKNVHILGTTVCDGYQWRAWNWGKHAKVITPTPWFLVGSASTVTKWPSSVRHLIVSGVDGEAQREGRADPEKQVLLVRRICESSICGLRVSQAFFDVAPWCSWLSANEITNANLISAQHLVTLIRQLQKCHQSDLTCEKTSPHRSTALKFSRNPQSLQDRGHIS